MALQGSGQISFSQIENEFGQNGERSLGDYRTSQNVGELSNLPLDSGIPTSGEIRFSDFYGKRLNIVVDMHSGGDEFRKSAKNDKWNNNNLTVIGGFRSKKEDGSKIIIHVNKTFGSDKSSVNNCAVRTGSWNSSSSIQVDVGGEGEILGAGGDGGNGGNCTSSGQPGGSGTSGLGIDHHGLKVKEASGGLILAGLLLTGNQVSTFEPVEIKTFVMMLPIFAFSLFMQKIDVKKLEEKALMKDEPDAKTLETQQHFLRL